MKDTALSFVIALLLAFACSTPVYAEKLLDRNTRVIHPSFQDGSIKLDSLFANWQNCLLIIDQSRGEYEKKAEFEARRKSLLTSCSAMQGATVVIEQPTKLRYDADAETFKFPSIEFYKQGDSGWFIEGQQRPPTMEFEVAPAAKTWSFGADKRYFGSNGDFRSGYFMLDAPLDKAKKLKSVEPFLVTRYIGWLQLEKTTFKHGGSVHSFRFILKTVEVSMTNQKKNILVINYE